MGLYLITIIESNGNSIKTYRHAKSREHAIRIIRETYKRNNDSRCIAPMSAFLIKEDTML